MCALLDVLQIHHADVLLTGHEHHYERFAPQTPDRVASSGSECRHRRRRGQPPVDSTSNDGADYDSKEAGPALAPQLILTVSALPAFLWNFLR